MDNNDVNTILKDFALCMQMLDNYDKGVKPMTDKQYTCCFCGKPIKFMESHNPWPLANETEGYRCCLECNNTKVIPARIQRFKDEETLA